MGFGEKERSVVCPDCNYTVYPKIMPAVIIGVTKGDDILMTRYRGREYKGHALVAGFCEIGETPEETGEKSGEDPAGKATGKDTSDKDTSDKDASDTRVNINTADLETLKTLPGIGDTRAQDILAFREKNGAFSKTEDLMQVPGIKEGTYNKLKDRIRTQ